MTHTRPTVSIPVETSNFQEGVSLLTFELMYRDMQPEDIGKCIYCGCEEELSTEHIIPYGLGGEEVLLNASCSDCAQATSEFEYEVLHKQVMQLRAQYDVPSRNNSVPDKLPLEILVDKEKEERVRFSTAEHPTLALFLLYPSPGVIGGDHPKEGINIIGNQLWQIGGPQLNEAAEKFGWEGIKFSETFVGNTFERLLAKIAFGFGVREYGLENLKESPLPSTILGQEDDAGKWIGCGRFYPDPADEMHQIDLEKQGDWILASVRLFANVPTPQYIVILQEGNEERQPNIPHGGPLPENLGESLEDLIDVSQDVEVSRRGG